MKNKLNTMVLKLHNCFGEKGNKPLTASEQIKAAIPIVAALYLWSLFICISLLYTNKYYNIGDAKYYYFKYLSLPMLPLLATLFIIKLIQNKQKITLSILKEKFTFTDYFVLLYACVLILSFLISPYKSTGLKGSDGWYMGLLTQLAILMIYFVSSRLFIIKKYCFTVVMIISGIVFFLGTIHRMGIDPLNLYQNIGICSFLSTIGQPTWYSSYLCCLYPLGVFLFWYEDNKRKRMIYAGYCFISFCTLVTQDSDSAYISLFLVFLTIFCLSFRSNDKLLHFFELTLLALGSFRLMGLLTLINPNYVYPYHEISAFLMYHYLSIILFIIIVIGYLLLIRYDHRGKLHTEQLQFFPKLALILSGTIIVLTIILIILVTNGWIPSGLVFLQNNNYLYFDLNWGDCRGINWTYTAQLYHDSSFPIKLFGCGPDCYHPYMYAHYELEMNAYWTSENIVDNAHNEWFNSLLTTGLFGFISYVGIFVSTIVNGLKNAPYKKELTGISLCILSYMGHNFFCYQQIVCTPIIFILIGIANNYLIQSKCIEKIRE